MSIEWKLKVGTIAALMMAACSDDAISVGGYDSADDAGSSGSSGASDAASTQPGTDAGVGDAPDGAPRVIIDVRASTAPIAHDAATSGQTPQAQSLAIRSLTLLRTPDDPAPYVVFDYGADSREADLIGAASTEVASVPAATLRAGSYTVARCGVAFVRYRIASTMHAFAQNVPGAFQNLHVLSDAVQVDGQARNRGHYEFSFEASMGAAPVALRGDDGVIPSVPSGAPFTLDLSTPDAAYVFPVALLIPEQVSTDYRVTFELNTHENFRWTDVAQPDYAAGVFDATPTSFEPVVAFGANSFALSAAVVP